MFTHHETSSSMTPTLIEQLHSSLIMSGIPSTAFRTTELTRDNTEYVFISPTFSTPGNEFITARWMWLVTYDNRFLATTAADGTEGYAIAKQDINRVTNRLQVIDSEPVAALHTYFIDHNMSPEHVTVSMTGDYLSTPEHDVHLTVEYDPRNDISDEAKNTELNGWNEATEPDSLKPSTATDESFTITVANARELLADRFGNAKETYWKSQRNNTQWALES